MFRIHRRASREKQQKSHRSRNAIAAGVGAVATVVGSVGGPPGMIAGAVIGGAVGLMVGTVLERDARSVSAHDRELDREIGVTSGTIGSPAEAKRGIDERDARDSAAEIQSERELAALSAELDGELDVKHDAKRVERAP